MPGKKGGKRRGKKAVKKGDDTQAESDISYTSNVWQKRVVASEIFINPTVTTGEGSRKLIQIANQGVLTVLQMTEFAAQTRESVHGFTDADHDHQYIYYSSLLGNISKRREQGAQFNERQVHRELDKKLERYELQKLRYHAATKLSNDLVYKFEQLGKVAQSLLTSQEELGEEIAVTDSGRKKIVVSAKCIDALWKDIITTHTQLKKLQDNIATTKMTLPPVPGRLKPGEIDRGEDEAGNKLGSETVWVYDPTNMVGGDKLVIGTDGEIEGLDADESGRTGPEAAPSSPDESTLVEEFEDQCQISSPSGCAGPASFTDAPATPDTEDSSKATHEEKSKRADVKRGGKRKAEEEESAVSKDGAEVQDEVDESDSEVLFICE
ncbi:hypothetical protein A1O7_06222 [Cladophialophora yegresii CBS 114405]|uniref:Uncharacterized protein n=1 Tax=Cladophialophora yegresii CBS 114405 TaxID=1182544 RepID=W9VSS3_9EURO|nr:uncharacterized protein A1O7_06222 [Cladophialophora yegresii CBS 114405]EXJ58792.1 hypothetical protein A1O7_06222 [Cladophialophora yegresii CBS 114405]